MLDENRRKSKDIGELNDEKTGYQGEVFGLFRRLSYGSNPMPSIEVPTVGVATRTGHGFARTSP